VSRSVITAHNPTPAKCDVNSGILAGFYRTGWPTVENLLEDADDDVFSRVLDNGNHVLHPLYCLFT